MVASLVILSGSSCAEKYPEVVRVCASSELGRGCGTGFFVSEDGYIVTAEHVVSYGEEDGMIYVIHSHYPHLKIAAEVMFTDATSDVAIIKISGRGHRSIPICEGSTIGDKIISIGLFDTGLEVAQGHVIDFVGYYVQTTTVIRQGFSGGPMLDVENACVMGVNSRFHPIKKYALGVRLEAIQWAMDQIVHRFPG